ncbi:hypothetical protein D3C81_479190 [compost metagenome]
MGTHEEQRGAAGEDFDIAFMRGKERDPPSRIDLNHLASMAADDRWLSIRSLATGWERRKYLNPLRDSDRFRPRLCEIFRRDSID